jgi:hypothetical protein
MPGPRHSNLQLGSLDAIVYHEFGGPPPRLSEAVLTARSRHNRQTAVRWMRMLRRSCV